MFAELTRPVSSLPVTNPKTNGKRTLDKVVLNFSDQQLIACLTILIAGYSESIYHGLAICHWPIVVYLGWMSSNVHLVSLTLLRPWLNKNRLLRNLRLSGMVILLALLAAAIYPSTSLDYILNATTTGKIPARCNWDLRSMVQAVQVYDNGPSYDTIISYVTLFSGYIWKVAQLFDSTNHRLRKCILVPVIGLERLAKRNADPPPKRWTIRWFSLKLIIYIYVHLVVLIEVADSFMATLLFLLGALICGTMNLSQARS